MVAESSLAVPANAASSRASQADQFEFLILADRAELINGKLYMMGGAWDHIWLGEFPHPYPLSLALGLRMKRELNKSEFELTFKLAGPDGADIHPKQFPFSRVSTPDAHREALVVLTVPALAVLVAPGEYILTATLDGAATKAVRFVVSQSDASMS